MTTQKPITLKLSIGKIKIFEIGKVYLTRFICDADMTSQVEVLKRTEKFVTVKVDDKIKRCKVYMGSDYEYIMPYGIYSMAPVCQAK